MAHPDRPGPTPAFPPQGSTRPGEVCEEVLLWRAVWGQSRGLGDRSSGKDSLSVAQPDRPGPTPVFPPQDSTQPEEVREEVLVWGAVRGQSRGQGDRSSGKDSLSVVQPDRPGPTPVSPTSRLFSA